MKNRLQFNRIPTIFSGETRTQGGEEVWVSGREQAKEALENYIKRGSFIPLIGEPIAVRYTDDKGDRQTMLAIGKSTGTSLDMVNQREYHIIDSAELQEGVSSANEKADNALDLASAATQSVNNYFQILKNMIEAEGIDLDDGSYFDDDDPTKDPSTCGKYKPLENSNYLDDAKNLREADKLLDEAIGGISDDLDELSGATASLSSTTQEYFNNIIEAAGLTTGEAGKYPGHDDTTYITNATSLDNADVLLDAAISELSANTIAAINETNNNLSELSAATINLSAGTVAVDAKVDELSANTVAADEALDNKIDELSANTMAADQELSDRISELEGNKILGVSAITVDVLENGDSKVSLVINEEDDKILSQNMLGLKAKVTLDYVSADKKIYLKGKNDIVISEIDATEFIKDGMLSAASVFTATEADHQQYPELVVGKTYIKLLFNVDGEEPGRANPVFISAEDLVDIYSVAPESHTYMEINDYVIKLNVDQEDGLASYDYARNISAVTATIIKAAGLNTGEPGSYPGHDETHYIKEATSLDNADVLLDEAIWETSGLVADISNRLDDLSGVTRGFSANTHNTFRELSGAVINLSAVTEVFSANTHNTILELSGAVMNLSSVTESFSANTVEALSALSRSVDERIESGLTVISGVVENYVEAMLSGLNFDEIYEYIDSADTALYEYIDSSIENLSGSILEYVIDNEEVTAAALNDLNRRTLYFETHYTGEYIPITNYTIATGTSEEELMLSGEDSINDAFGKIQKQILDNEEAVAAGLNDLSDRVNENAEAIARSTGVTALSAAVVTFSSSTVNEFNNVNNKITNVAGDLSGLSAFTQYLSAHSLGVLTVNLNGVEQGQYCPSASTTLNLEAIQEVTGADVLLTGYELSSGTTEEELAVVATDTVNEAFGKIQKQIYDDEEVIAGALNDLDERISGLEICGGTENFFDGAEYVPSAKTIVFKHGDIIKATIDATDFLEELSAGTVQGLTYLSGVIEDNELVIAAAFNDLNDRVLELSANTPDMTNYYNKTEVNQIVEDATQRKYQTANTLTNLNFQEFLTIVEINGDTTLSIANTGLPVLPANGVAERHVIIKNNNPNSAATVEISSGDSRVILTFNDKIAIDPKVDDKPGIGELNALITYDGSAYTIYVITT